RWAAVGAVRENMPGGRGGFPAPQVFPLGGYRPRTRATFFSVFFIKARKIIIYQKLLSGTLLILKKISLRRTVYNF
ncbi:hypothetical protein, partial [Enterobacter hormaechei]